MTRTLFALALASVSCVVVAAPPLPVPVEVTNPVLPVELSNADPIPVSISGGLGGQPVQASASSSCNSFACNLTVYTVPAGKLLIVEFVSANTSLTDPAARAQVGIFTKLANATTFHELGLLDQRPYTAAFGGNHLRSFFPLQLFAQSESEVIFQFKALGTMSDGIQATLSGRLVDSLSTN